MLTVQRVFPRDESEWDCHFEGRYPAGLGQSHFYARLFGQIDGSESVFLQCDHGGTAVGWLLLMEKRLSDRSQMLDWIDGPVMMTEDAPEEVGLALLDWISRYARDRRIARAYCHGLPIDRRSDSTLDGAFASRGYDRQPWATFIVDLCTDEEALWKGLNRAVRKAVNKCSREGLSVVRAGSPDQFANLFYPALSAGKAAAGLTTRPREVYDVVFEEDRKSRYAYYVAVDADHVPLGTLGVHTFGGTATEIASSVVPTTRLPVQDLLHWHALKLAKKDGCHQFDLAGVHPNPLQNSKEAGIRRFKAKWGGTCVDYGRYGRHFAWLPRIKQWARKQSALSLVTRAVSVGR